MKIERRPKKYSLQITTERHQRWRIPDGWRQTVPCTCRSHWSYTCRGIACIYGVSHAPSIGVGPHGVYLWRQPVPSGGAPRRVSMVSARP